MLTISRKADYAARIVLYLAMQPPGATITAREAAQERLIPPALARRLFSVLAQAGFLKGRQGKGGGFSLARPPAEINLREVVEAVDGPIVLNRCAVEPQECPLMLRCPVHEQWVGSRQLLREYLSRIDFRQLAQRGEELNPPDVGKARR